MGLSGVHGMARMLDIFREYWLGRVWSPLLQPDFFKAYRWEYGRHFWGDMDSGFSNVDTIQEIYIYIKIVRGYCGCSWIIVGCLLYIFSISTKTAIWWMRDPMWTGSRFPRTSCKWFTEIALYVLPDASNLIAGCSATGFRLLDPCDSDVRNRWFRFRKWGSAIEQYSPRVTSGSRVSDKETIWRPYESQVNAYSPLQTLFRPRTWNRGQTPGTSEGFVPDFGLLWWGDRIEGFRVIESIPVHSNKVSMEIRLSFEILLSVCSSW